MKNKIRETNIKIIGELCKGTRIDDDLLIVDSISQVPIPQEPVRFGCLLLALCMKGRLEYCIDTVKQVANAGDIIIVSEGQVASDYNFSSDINGVAILVSKDFFDEAIKNVHEASSMFLFARSHPVYNIYPDEAQMLLDYVRLLRTKIDVQQHHFRREVAQSLITTMLYDIGNAIYRVHDVDSTRTRAEGIFRKFIELLDLHSKTERRVGWYAMQLNITPKYLSDIVRQVSHRTPNDWIDDYVVRTIRLKLRNSTSSIKEIAQELHFPNQSFFGKYFREHVGVSPSEYRKKK